MRIAKRSWWLAGILLFLVCGGLIFATYWFGWSKTGFLSKSLWDWMQLLIIPFVLAIAAFLFNRAERKNEQEIALDNQRETALQAYLDKMSEILLKENLLLSRSDDKVRNVARARTLSVLSGFDGKRKGSLILFLYESGLIDINDCFIDLSGADLKGAHLSNTNLNNIDLSKADLSWISAKEAPIGTNSVTMEIGRTNLSGANLRGADIVGANLKGVLLTKADLHGVELSLTDLTEAILIGANLSEAFLQETDLHGSNLTNANITKANLTKANLLGAILRGADLNGVDLSNTFVTQDQLDMVKPNRTISV